ncbi:MAG: SLC13 family permease [Candidatus Ranarchaeia archaeon]
MQHHTPAANVPLGLVPFISIAIISIFIVVLLLILSHKVNKAVAALLGAGAIYFILFWVTNGLYQFEDFIIAVDLKTLLIIAGLMISVALIEASGLFQFIAIKAVKSLKGDSYKIFLLFCFMSIAIASLLTTVATMLILGRLTISVCRAIDKNPLPYLLTEGILANVGGIMTSIASLPNIMISVASGYSFIYITLNFVPLGLILLVVSIFYFRNLYKDEIKASPSDSIAYIMEFDEWSVVPDKVQFWAAIVTLTGIVIGFILLSDSWAVAMIAGAVLMLVSRRNVEKSFENVEWTTIFFFAALFALVGGLEYMGVLEQLGHLLAVISQSNLVLMILINIWLTGILSSIVDNIPITATMIPVTFTIAETAGFTNLDPLWWSLICGVGLGGSITPIGSPSVVLALSLSDETGTHVSAGEYIKIGGTAAIIQLSICSVFLLSAWVLLGPEITVIASYIIAILLIFLLLTYPKIKEVALMNLAKRKIDLNKIEIQDDKTAN